MRLKIEEVAKVLNVSAMVVRYGMQTGSLPGSYIKASGNRRGSYIITSSQLAEHLKMPEEKVIKMAKKLN